MQPGPNLQPDAAPAMARKRRTRTVARQLNLIGKIFESLGPKRKLARNRALRLVLVTQNSSLPKRVICILNRQGRKIRNPSRAASRVTARNIPPQRRQRPAVTRNVMQNKQQYVLVPAKLK